MGEKLTDTLTIRVGAETADLLTRLAHVEGLSDAELVRKLIDDHIQIKHTQHILLARAFAGYVNKENNA